MNKVYCGFPGVGKSHLFKTNPVLFADSDSSLFSKEKDFPNNYVEHVVNVSKNKTVLCSTHLSVRHLLASSNIPYVLVYPKTECLDEYIKRYTQRGSTDAFIKMMREQWTNFIGQLENDTGCFNRIVLEPGEYLNINHLK